MDVGVRDGDHQLREEAEHDRLLGGELGAEQGAEDVVVELDDAGQDLLARAARQLVEPGAIDVEQIELQRPFRVGRVQEDQAAILRRIEAVEARERADHVALAVDRHHGRAAGIVEIGEHHGLHELRLAVADAGDDVRVLEACLQRNRERNRRAEELKEWRAGKIRLDELQRREPETRAAG